MSRFELECKLTIKDTSTGETAILIDNNYHMKDELLTDETSLVGSFLSDLQAALLRDKENGAVNNYSRFTKFVENFYNIVEEIDPIETQSLETMFEEIERELSELEESQDCEFQSPFKSPVTKYLN